MNLGHVKVTSCAMTRSVQVKEVLIQLKNVNLGCHVEGICTYIVGVKCVSTLTIIHHHGVHIYPPKGVPEQLSMKVISMC